MITSVRGYLLRRFLIVAFKRNELDEFPKGTIRNLMCLVQEPFPFSDFNNKRWTSLASRFTLICRKALDMSPVIAMSHVLKRTSTSTRSGFNEEPVWRQSFKDLPLMFLADASTTGLILVLVLLSLIIGRCKTLGGLLVVHDEEPPQLCYSSRTP